MVGDCDRRLRPSEATVAARTSRHLGEAVLEQPADERSLGRAVRGECTQSNEQ
jgi:hypothetical protein